MKKNQCMVFQTANKILTAVNQMQKKWEISLKWTIKTQCVRFCYTFSVNCFNICTSWTKYTVMQWQPLMQFKPSCNDRVKGVKQPTKSFRINLLRCFRTILLYKVWCPTKRVSTEFLKSRECLCNFALDI